MLGEHKTQLLHAVEVITVCLPEAQLLFVEFIQCVAVNIAV